MKKLVLLGLGITFSVTLFAQNTFTSNNATPGTDFNNVANWTGTGTPNFSNGLDVFIIRDGDSYTATSNLNIKTLTLGQGGAGGALTLPAGTATLDLEGNMIFEVNSTLTANDNQVNIAGNWTVNSGASFSSTGTVIFDAALVQTISTDATFNNLTFSGGGVVTTGGDVSVNGSWLITNNTTFSTGDTHTLSGDITVDDGSVYNATDGILTLNGSVDQAMNIGSNATFDRIYFNPGAAININVTGDLVANDLTLVYPNATLNGSGDHSFQGLRQEGTCNFTGSITFTGGTVYDNDDNAFSLGTADITISGSVNFSSGDDDITVGGNLTVDGNYLVLNEGSVTGSGGTLQINNGNTLYVRGVDNFPTGFGLVVFEDNTARANYDMAGNQTVRGNITYGRLALGNSGTKTVDGSLDIDGYLDLNNGISLNLSTFNHTLAGDLYNQTDASISQTGGTFTFDAPDANQRMEDKGTGTYMFSTLVFTNTAPTAVRTKNIDATNVSVTNFSVTNTGGSASNYLIVDIDANLMVGFGSYSIGSNVELRTSGASEFNSMMAFFTESIDPQSTILFDGTTQSLPGITYGNVEIRGDGNKNATGAMTVTGDFSRIAETPVFVDGGFTHSVAGNWEMGTAYTDNMTGTMIFNGTAQTISASDFNNLTFSGSGVKTLEGDLNVGRDVAGPLNGNLTINNGVTVNAGIYSIDMIGGHWVNGGTGAFSQTTGTVFFSSTQTSQNITSNSNNIFGDLDITNGASRTVTAQTDIVVSRDFDLVQNLGDFNLQGFTLYVGRDFSYRTGTSFNYTLPGATIHFNGDTDQYIRNYITGTYPNLTFSGLGEKILYDNGFNIDGDVTITTTTLDGTNLAHTVAGDWVNNGSFQHTNSITFDGADQDISASTFHDAIFSGTGTKTLSGNITLNGRLQINDGVTLDVSASNYKITVEENWTNTGTGVFDPRNGTVEISGGYSQLFTGASGYPSAGKHFYNILINTNTSRADIAGDLIIEGDILINSSANLRIGSYAIYVAGNFTNSGTFDFNNSSGSLIFNGTSGTHTIDPGGAGFRKTLIDASGAIYQLQSELSFIAGVNNAPVLIVSGGTLDLNGNEILFPTNYTLFVDITGGTLEVDAGSSLRLGRDTRITNSGGVFKIVGTPSNPAVVNSLDPDVGDYYDYTQTGGTIEAQYYSISNCTNNGFDIQGGSIDAVNNFSNGVFSNGAGTAYMTLDIPFMATVPNVIFNVGPSFNVSAPNDQGGALAVDFQDALGGLSGETNDSDAFDQISWSFSGTGLYWDGGGDGISWNDPTNWSTDVVPTGTDVVFLDHTNVGGSYSVDILTIDAVGLKLVLDAGGSNDITLTVKNGRVLDIEELLTIIDGTLTQENSSEIKLAGAFSNSGTYNSGSNTFTLDGSSGIYTFNPNSNPFYNLTVDASGAQYNLDNNMVVNNNMLISNGTFSVIGNKLITLSGNWTTNGGSFDPGTGEIRFSGTSGTQTIYGGLFYAVSLRNAGSKQLTSNATVLDDITFHSGFTGTFDGQNYVLKVGDDWINDRDVSVFSQSGSGAVIFNGGGQQIRGTASTTFNTVFFSGTGAKIVQISANVNGDMNILSGITRVEIDPGVTVAGTVTGTLTQTGGQLRLEDTDNFPAGFGTINLIDGEVYYYANIDQNIFATTYYDLRIGSVNAGFFPVKNITGDITVNDDILFNDIYVTLAANDFTINLEDAISLPTGGTQIDWGVAGGTGTLNHFGDYWNIDPDITGFNNLILDGSGYKYVNSDLTITGDVTINDAITLEMNGNSMTGTGTESFTMLGSSRVITDDIADPLPAFPTAFGTYSLASTSRVTLNGSGDQVIYTTPTYGRLDVYSNNNATLDGNLDVDGDFYMNDNAVLVDGGFDMNFGGDVIDIRDYTPTGGTTVTLDGGDQTLRDDDATSIDYLDFANLVLGGTGTKDLTGGQDYYRVSEEFTINNSITVDLSRDFEFSGTNFTNNGTLNHTANTINFNGTGVQTINPGANHSFQTTRFENAGGTKTITGNGLNIDGGQLEFFSNATVDFGSLTHNLAITNVSDDATETLITASANVIYDRLGTQTIVKDREWTNITFAGTGTKYVNSQLTGTDITINNGVTLSMSNDNGTTVGGFVVRGSWDNSGIFTDYTSTVAFESPDGTAKTIDNNGSQFYNVTFNQTQTSSRTYTLLSDHLFQEDLTIGSGATLVLNGFDLTLGNNDAGNPDAEQHSVAAGATLTISPGSTLLFDATDNGSDDTSDTDPTLTVDGTLNIVGTNGNLARIDRSAGNYRIDIDIQSGGTVNARYYEISTVSDDGFDIQSGAIVAASGASNNFSDGTWSGISTSGSGNYVYLNIEADATGLSDISNVTFNHSGSPSQGVHFNVRRSGGATGAITFAGTINGLLAGEYYEDDSGAGVTTPGQIIWPPLTQTTWTGAISTDWSVAGNWTGGVPTNSIEAIIGLQSNNPIIDGTSGDGQAKAVTITNGILTIDAGNDLVSVGDVVVGQGSLSGVLAIGDPGSDVFVGGGMTIGTNGIYIHGSGTITFNATGGTVTITPNSATMYGMSFTGSATYLLAGSTLDVNGPINITNGTLEFSTNNYTAKLANDLLNNGGLLGTSTSGTVVLDGADQTVKDVNFDNLTVSGTMTKTLQGTVSIGGDLLVNSTLDAGTSSLTMNGDVTISVSGAFDDGDGTHYFGGQDWTGTGAYSGNGTIVFNRTGNQYIYASKFNNLDIDGTNTKYLYGDTDLTGDLTLRSTIASMRLESNLFNCTSGTGTFTTESAVDVFILGSNNYPSGFATYSPDATSLARYEGTSDQTIRGVQYGRLYLLNSNTKTLGGNINVDGDLDFNTATLDVSASNYEIRLAGEWDNNDGGSFIARNGQVILDGSVAGYQEIRAGLTGTKDFYDLRIDKSAGTARYLGSGVDVAIQNDLIIQNGDFRNEYNNRSLTIGNSINCIGGIIETSGVFEMTKASGTGFITSNGSVFQNLDINAGGTIVLQDDLAVDNLFDVTAGTFNANGKTVELGNYLDVVNIAGTYIAGAGGRLELGNQVSLTVISTGTIELVGTSGSPVTVTRRTTNTYNFNVQGTIKARHYLFEYMGANGIKIANGATIDATDNFSDGTFTNGYSGGTLFNIENTQDLTGNPGRIENVVFPAYPGGGASNVSKLIAGSGNVEFYDASGVFAGSNFENDPGDLIDWTGSETLTWTAGAGTSDWFTAGNWESNLGGNKVPTSADAVIIDNTPVIQPIITTDGTAIARAEAKSLTIDFGSVLTLNTSSDDSFSDLEISGDITIDGILIANGSEDRIQINGGWTRGSSGSFTPSTCKVDFGDSGGIDVINNGASPFYQVTIESGDYQLGSGTYINNDLVINLGATLDASSSNYTLYVSGDFSNSGTFTAQQGTLNMTSSIAGAKTIDTGSSSLYNLTINSVSTASYSLLSTISVRNGLAITSSSLDINGHTLNMGDGSGSDVLNINGTNAILTVGPNGTLSMGSNSALQLQAGKLQIVGTDNANKAVVNSQSGRYSFVVTGGELSARYYSINNLNSTGLNIKSGASINSTNNLSNGSFSNGAAGGRYLLLENNLASDITLNSVVFNSGPAVNAKRLTGANNYIFNDATGVLAGSGFEDDNPANGDSDGRIRWTYTSLNTWDGSTSADWNDPTNWSLNAVPLATNDVLIPSGMPNDPVLNSLPDGNAKDLTIQSGATLEFDGTATSSTLTLTGSFSNAGTLTHTSGFMYVEGNWTNTGAYTPVSSANTRVTLTAPTGTLSIETGGDTFSNLYIDSDDGGDGDAVFQTVDPIVTNLNLVVTDGTLQVMDPSHSITINNTSGVSIFDISSDGSLIHGNGTVNLIDGGTGIQLSSNSAFYNLTTSGSDVTLSSNIDVENDLVLGANTSASTYTITLQGDFTNTGTFTAGTSTLSLVGSSTQSIASTGGITLNNLTVNNTSSTVPQVILNNITTVSGILTLTDGVVSSTVTNYLHLSGGTLSGGSSASYVDGPMRRTGTGDFTFPVGDGLIYARIGAESTPGSNSFTAQYFDAAAPNPGNISQGGDGGALNHVSGAEYWDLSRNSGSNDPLIRLYWEDGVRSEITDLSGGDLVVAHYTGGNWESEGQGIITGTTSAGTVRSASTLTSLSPIAFGSAFNMNALPVELVSFTGEVAGSTIALKWVTASEINNDYFTLLRSKDGQDFEEMTTVLGAGTVTVPIEYSYVDERPYNGLSYYKLQQTDFNGITSDVGIVSVRMKNSRANVVVNMYPNPFGDVPVTVGVAGLNPEETVSVVIIDAFGREYYTTKSTADDQGYLDMTIDNTSEWDSGIYVIGVMSEKGYFKTKVIKR